MFKVGIQHIFNQNPDLSTDPVFQAVLPFGSSSFRLWRLGLRLMFTITRNNGMKYNSLYNSFYSHSNQGMILRLISLYLSIRIFFCINYGPFVFVLAFAVYCRSEKLHWSGYFFFREVYGRITLPQPATFPVDLRDFLHVSQRFGQHVAMKQMN